MPYTSVNEWVEKKNENMSWEIAADCKGYLILWPYMKNEPTKPLNLKFGGVAWTYNLSKINKKKFKKIKSSIMWWKKDTYLSFVDCDNMHNRFIYLLLPGQVRKLISVLSGQTTLACQWENVFSRYLAIGAVQREVDSCFSQEP